MNFREYLKNNIVYLDGGMGTLLQSKGLQPGELPEIWNLTHADVVTEIHKSYYDAGSNVVSANTFGANIFKFSYDELESIIKAAIVNVKTAAMHSTNSSPKFVALDIGPLGKLLKPMGDLDFEDAVAVFAETVKLGVKYGADLVLIETMNDCYETKAALLAAKENCDLPVLVSNAYGEDGKLMTGATPSAMVAMAEGMGADAIGANCSLGPKQLRSVVEELLEKASIPVILQPNAGLPKVIDGKTVFDVTPDEFAEEVVAFAKKGVRIVGGCCGTTAEYIKLLKERSSDIPVKEVLPKNITTVSSYTHSVEFNVSPILIGERINPTGKKRFKQALIENDIDYILAEGVNQQDKGVHILDVNVGIPEIDEASLLCESVCRLQEIIDLPLQIDTSDIRAMEKALRRYNGKAMINSINGKKEVMEAIFPLVKKYGGLVVALTLDEDGIPETADGRFEIAKKILKTASVYGIDKKNIIFDALAMTISADNNAAQTTLNAMNRINKELGCHTLLGVSNISFGLPNRDAVNGVFFALALESGLSAAIMNPYSADMMKTYYAYRALKGIDENCSDYIENAESFIVKTSENMINHKTDDLTFDSELQKAIIKGFKNSAGEITQELLKTVPPLEIIQNDIIPALNIVGQKFEQKTLYLPQLLMSAESAKTAFDYIKSVTSVSKVTDGIPFVLATVKGDIHDIGKNIVKLLMENYGFDVIDLGKDVPPEAIADKVVEVKAPVAGLSALMTTTVPAMEKTVEIIHKKAPWCKVVVGGAVLTEEYAAKIGADKYSKDAMETVRYAMEFLNKGMMI